MTMKQFVTVFMLVLFLLASLVTLVACEAGTAQQDPDSSVTEHLIAKDLAANDTRLIGPIISPDARRIAYVLQKENGQSAVIDGVEGKLYERIENLKFSPDGRRVAYVAISSLNKIIVVDANEAAKYDYAEIINGVTFSPDGRHTAYVLKKLDVSGRMNPSWYAVVQDGVESKHYYSIDINPAFSPDSNHMAYTIGFGDGRQVVVIDGIEGEIYTNIMPIGWSADNRFLYLAKILSTRKEVVVINEVEGKPYDSIRRFNFFSPDGKKIVYIAKEGNEAVMVVDGVEVNRYQGDIYAYFFSPDNMRVACMVRTSNNKCFVVIDGVESEKYDEVGNLQFSPNSKRVAYVAKAGNKWFMVVDGEKNREYEYVPSVYFSPDGNRLVYKVRVNVENEGLRSFVIVDGIEENQYINIGSIVFSPDSRRLVYVASPSRWSQTVVENRSEGKRYSWDETDSSNSYVRPVFSVNGEHLAYTVKTWLPETKSNKWVLVYDGQEGKQYDSIISFMFSPDGNHIVYVANNLKDKSNESSRRWYVMIDGVEREYTRLLSEVIFDSNDTLHYLTIKGKNVYLVEEKLG
jgi:Tol biopolymer transport system component